ncbi:hypothetical protein HYU94_00895 [Candidatus Daviesbacteria bacterium]|nr:hypothetical protein [Candidatus Daviesbacteria bacterium]
MNKQIIFIAAILAILFSILFLRNKTEPMVNPLIKQSVTPIPTTTTINQPKEVKYNSSTDLEKELETVDPQVSDGDFN